ncbi:MAG TPA: AMP-binding protein [Dokdonella sp.]|uniref:class I adenylate-forming enzyme family protein n=2 Tax=Dokdonella sp. TaxID=2291710 RepID=UPI002B996C2F|nr:AMP-binding protein [Dokdonella sp.]HOX72148.1 AMP-binding protein [Dokdonella sp.]HPG93339.1 AMP-binding protein [Dokdonella sp.]HPN78003.1 AMP-binding protein [Dokdonella sp.]
MIRFESLLARAARRDPSRIALVTQHVRATYADFDAAASRFAAGLVGSGFAHGERCVILADNRFETAVAIFGTLRAGGIFSVINPMTKADKLAFVLNDCEAAVLVTQASLLGVARNAAKQVPSLRRIVVIDAVDEADGPSWHAFMTGAADLAPGPPRGIDIDLAMLVYTSGSTGRPKGVMMTHRNMVFAATSITTYLESRSDDVVLSVLPLAFDYGLYQLLMCVMCGSTLVLERSFAFPQNILPLLSSEGVTGFPLVPTMAALILQLRSFDPAWARSVRYLTNTAAALPPAHIARLRSLFSHARVFSMYGQTESKRCTYLPPEQLEQRPDSVGIAIPGTEVWVADDDGKPVAANVIGELVVRGGHVMQGYWNNEEATRRALRPGRYPWEKVLHTGDLFRIDDEGYCYFVARKDDMIKSRGEKVSPKEIENVLYALPGVSEAIVVGVPDAMLGQALKAFIVRSADSSISARDVIAHCAARLEDFMTPRLIEFRDALPKTSTGKIRRAALQAEVENREIPPE